jgi:hypothetical protein
MITTNHPPNLPIPAGAEVSDWHPVIDGTGDFVRFLTWAKFDTARCGVAVDGCQDQDGPD